MYKKFIINLFKEKVFTNNYLFFGSILITFVWIIKEIFVGKSFISLLNKLDKETDLRKRYDIFTKLKNIVDKWDRFSDRELSYITKILNQEKVDINLTNYLFCLLAQKPDNRFEDLIKEWLKNNGYMVGIDYSYILYVLSKTGTSGSVEVMVDILLNNRDKYSIEYIVKIMEDMDLLVCEYSDNLEKKIYRLTSKKKQSRRLFGFVLLAGLKLSNKKIDEKKLENNLRLEIENDFKNRKRYLALIVKINILVKLLGFEKCRNDVERLMNHNNMRLVLNGVKICLENKITPTVETIKKVAKCDSKRIGLYKLLDKYERKDLFPYEYRDQKMIIKSFLEIYEGVKINEEVNVEKNDVKIGKQTFRVYICRYKIFDKHSNEYILRIGVCGLFDNDDEVLLPSEEKIFVWEEDKKSNKEILNKYLEKIFNRNKLVKDILSLILVFGWALGSGLCLYFGLTKREIIIKSVFSLGEGIVIDNGYGMGILWLIIVAIVLGVIVTNMIGFGFCVLSFAISRVIEKWKSVYFSIKNLIFSSESFVFVFGIFILFSGLWGFSLGKFLFFRNDEIIFQRSLFNKKIYSWDEVDNMRIKIDFEPSEGKVLPYMVIYPKNGDEIVIWKETGPEELSGDSIIKIIEMAKTREIEIEEDIDNTYSEEVLRKYSKKVRSDVETVMKYFGKI